MPELPVTLVAPSNPRQTGFVRTVHCPWTHVPQTIRRCWGCREYLGYLNDPKRGKFVCCNREEERAQ